MYYNVFGEKVSRARYKLMLEALKNRQELIAAGLTGRRDLFKMGLLTAGGMLVAKSGLSARAQLTTTSPSTGSPGSDQLCVPANQPASPPTTPFVEHLTILPIAQVALSPLSPAPTICPNTNINPATGLPFERRAACHQAPELNSSMFPFPPNVVYQFTQKPVTVSQSPSLPLQTIWGFNDGTNGTISPGPVYRAFYGTPQLTRNINGLPPANQNGGFGIPSVTTHLHNGHTPSESDGNPCDFYEIGQFCDQYYPNVLAGFNSTNPPPGDINEALSTLWYHDHRVDFTSQNTYKGLLGFYLLFNQFDTGDETTGFHLPSYPQFDVPIILNDKLLDPTTGLICFDTFNFKGLIGDVQLANGIVQPFFNVNQRRYRFRVLDGGPSRFYELFLTDPNNVNTQIPFWVIANDGNLLPKPVQVTSFRIGVAERYDIIIDFTQVKKLLGSNSVVRLENRLEQKDGKGPTGNILSPGTGTYCVEFRIGASAADGSVDPATGPSFYTLPSVVAPRITRNFVFDRQNGQWVINNQFADCNVLRFAVEQNSAENWVIINPRNDWQHPIHIHLEEHQILSRVASGRTGRNEFQSSGGYSGDGWGSGGYGTGNGSNGGTNANGVPTVEIARKDVTRLQFNETDTLFFRFRDFQGDWPMHCHNTVHEDHAMLLLFQVQPGAIDNNQNP